ncbi:MAG: rod shape-determining protein RodA [Christensenellaceae bacterium]|nr:rod shape-determining protein RodA [Christensenellaceae bacterium]
MKSKRGSLQLVKNLDWMLIGIVVIIVLFGVVSLLSVTNTGFTDEELPFWDFIDTLDFEYARLQLIYFAVGIVIAIAATLIDYNNIRDFTVIVYWVSIAMLVLVLLFGSEVNGTKGWFKFGSRGFQPAEVCKVTMIVVFAKEFSKATDSGKHGISSFKDLWPLMWRFAIPFALVLLQKDFGTSMVYLFIFIGMMFIAKTSLKIMGILGGVVLGAAPLAWFVFFDEYQKERIINLFNPEQDLEGSGYNVAQAKNVLKAGGMEGKGFFSSDLLTQSSTYLPEDHTDFIFSATGEAIGFWGSVLLIAVYFILLLRMVMLALKAKDDFGSLIIMGVVFMFLFHIVENIGMNIGVMPVTGIPLPLFSYGGSYMLTSMAALGLVLNVNMRRTRTAL